MNIDVKILSKLICNRMSIFSNNTSVDTELYCPKGKCGCQYFILTLKKKFMDTGFLDFFLIKN